MANDLGTIGILVDVRGMPLVKDLAKDLNNVATAEKQVSAATQKVVADMKRAKGIMDLVKKSTEDTSTAFRRLSLQELQQTSKQMQVLEKRLISTRRSMGQMGMATQQVGYQVGDFLVQVQSGTNFMVAFGQQATQLVGILPAFSKQLGMSVGSLIGISSGLGIAIPLLTAIGAVFMRTGEQADQGAKGVDKYKEAIEGLQSATATAQSELNKLTFGTEDAAIASARKAMMDAQIEIDKLLTSQRKIRGVAAPTAEEQAAVDAMVANYRELVINLNQLNARQAALAEAQNMLNGGLSVAAGIQKGLVYDKEVELRAAKELLQAHASQLEVMGRTKAESEALAEAASKAGVSAQQLSHIDFSNISTAATEALRLAGNLGISLDVATRLAALGPQGIGGNDPSGGTYSGRGALSQSDIVGIRTAGMFGYTKIPEAVKKGTSALKEAEKAAEALRKELEAPLVSAVGSVSDAFGDFVARGLTDFKGFVKSILASFQNMIAQMIAMAVKNRIMLSLGIGGITPTMAAAGQVAGLGPAGGMLGSLGIGKGIGGLAGGTGFLGGAGNAIAGLGGGGAGLFSVGANAAAAGGGIGATIGALAPPLLAVAAVFSFFKKKTKELDNGLRITVNNMDALVETFKTVQTTQFFGLSKKVTTTVEAASAEISDPIVKAVQDIQGQVLKAAGVFGIAESAFSDFLYNLEVSLKGLTEEQKIQKVNEELVKMGDSFAALTGHFSTMNELLEAANQRMELQNRLDTLLGNNQAVLLRQREAEIAATHELNRPLLTAIFTLEDAKSKVDRAFTALRNAIDKTVEDLQKKLSVANEAVTRSRGIFQQLENALSGRVLRGSGSQFSMRRQSALGFLRRGDFSDERQLEEALGVVSEPTEDLYRSFEDYARDFYYTSGIIEDAKKIAEVQLTADEKQVALLEKQIADAQSQYDLMMQQYNELMGINEGVLGVKEAVIEVQKAIATLGKAMAAAQAAAAAGVAGGAAANVIKANTAGQKLIGEFGAAGTAIRKSDEAVFEKIVLKGDKQLLAAAADLGIKTSGKTGAQIQQEISNKGNLGVGLDSKTRAQKFAMGGMFGGGLRIVGEQGPELEATGPSRIFSNRQTSEMFRDPELTNSVTELKNEVSRMRSEQLQIQLEISKNTKRIYDTERKWDVDGLPATRT